MTYKEDLIEKCTIIFTSYDVKVSTDEISRMLGVSKRTLYEFFNSKESLIYECANFTIERMKTIVDAHFEKNTNNVIEKLFPMGNPKLQKMLVGYNRFFKIFGDCTQIYTDKQWKNTSNHIKNVLLTS
jgi:AcrR family transcriptional regulator